MPRTKHGPLIEGGDVVGWYREVEKENGDIYREERRDRGNGNAEWKIKTFDGVEKKGVIEPGGGDSKGVGN